LEWCPLQNVVGIIQSSLPELEAVERDETVR